MIKKKDIHDSETVISVENLSKKYKLYSDPNQIPYLRLKELLTLGFKKYHQEFWALKNINLDVKKGHTIGIIGKNGSGKSTLLKLIAGITYPTNGKLYYNGRIATLLELGVGFCPELTGRENISLQAALMGYSKKEITEKELVIEQFADIKEYIDQPVKHYSSGMFVRLGFSCAIHSDPDILIVDEALSVGDKNFQDKCYKKILDLQNSGKTILIVSHDMNAILKHCDYAIHLYNGSIIKSGKPKEIIEDYLGKNITRKIPKRKKGLLAKTGKEELDRFFKEKTTEDNCIYRYSYNENEKIEGDKRAEFLDYLIVNGNNYDPVEIQCGDSIDIYIKALFHKFVKSPIFGFHITDPNGFFIYGDNTVFANVHIQPANIHETVICKFSINMSLFPSDYLITFGCSEATTVNNIETYRQLEKREGIIILSVKKTRHFTGNTYLASTFEEQLRNNVT